MTVPTRMRGTKFGAETEQILKVPPADSAFLQTNARSSSTLGECDRAACRRTGGQTDRSLTRPRRRQYIKLTQPFCQRWNFGVLAAAPRASSLPRAWRIVDAFPIFRGHRLVDIAVHRNRAGDVPGTRRAERAGTGVRACAERSGNGRAGRGSSPSASSRQKQGNDAIYDALARQYEQFRQVDRTFELVAKAVSPAVVHIVAKKVTRGDDGRRPRDYEETGSGVIVRSDRAPGLYVLTNHHVVEGSKPAEDPGLLARRASDLAG